MFPQGEGIENAKVPDDREASASASPSWSARAEHAAMAPAALPEIMTR